MKIYLRPFSAVILAMWWGIAATANAQQAEQEYLVYWKTMDSTFSDPAKSPLTPAAIAIFDSIPRFDFNEKFRVEAEWEPIEAAKPQQIMTTTDSKRLMQKAGVFNFKIDGVQVALYVYRDLTMERKQPGRVSYFLPFTDLSNGETTYMGGRYMDLDEELLRANPVILDFNRAYNPYCVYSDRYSCPIPPAENSIPLRVEAGARVDDK